MLKVILYITLTLLFTFCDNKEKKVSEYDIETENAIPMIKFISNNDSIWFMVDTGSNYSVIDKNYYESNKDNFIELYKTDTTIVTIHGEETLEIKVVLYKLNNNINTTLSAMDISHLAQVLKAKHNVEIVGLLGSDFLTEKSAILDFNKNRVIIIEYDK